MAIKYLVKVGNIRYIRDWINRSSANGGNHWVQIGAYGPGTTNWCDINNYPRPNPVTGSSAIMTGNAGPSGINRVVNGTTNSDQYIELTGSSLQSITIDLGQLRPVTHIKVWHYHADARTYYDKKTEVSVDGINWTTVYDDNLHRQYVETSDGQIMSGGDNYLMWCSYLNPVMKALDKTNGTLRWHAGVEQRKVMSYDDSNPTATVGFRTVFTITGYTWTTLNNVDSRSGNSNLSGLWVCKANEVHALWILGPGGSRKNNNAGSGGSGGTVAMLFRPKRNIRVQPYFQNGYSVRTSIDFLSFEAGRGRDNSENSDAGHGGEGGWVEIYNQDGNLTRFNGAGRTTSWRQKGNAGTTTQKYTITSFEGLDMSLGTEIAYLGRTGGSGGSRSGSVNQAGGAGADCPAVVLSHVFNGYTFTTNTNATSGGSGNNGAGIFGWGDGGGAASPWTGGGNANGGAAGRGAGGARNLSDHWGPAGASLYVGTASYNHKVG